ncbi:MAG: hypothetical protein KAW12_25050 [Candidatus Aminicenantes bacterium]|nr:hypothetical protein [Candidatus Aminicenantes bacterium]
MSKISKPIIHETWGFDRLSLYLGDAFRVLYEAYRIILVEKRKSPYTKPVSKKNWHLENILTEDLIETAVDIPRRLDYQWDTESKDPKKKNRIDITIIYSLRLGFEKRLGIECKRLKDDAQLCREYYENGIKRFVTGYYSEKMPMAGMIGFIQEGGIKEIIRRIDTYLDKQTTTQSLTIKKIIENIEYTYFSSHNRDVDSGSIALYHMMLDYREIIR